MTSKIKKKLLRPGDTIGIAAPASPFERRAFDQGVAVLKGMGFEVKIPETLFERQGYLAGADAQRAKQLMALFEDDAVAAVWCARGGFGSMRLLPLLDLGLIAAHPKPLVGFSDVTALLVNLYQKCKMVTYHGPLVTTIATEPEESRAAILDIVGSNDPVTLFASEPIEICPGEAAGPLLGGNLTCLSHLMGTDFAPKFDGHLLFLEDRGEALYRIDRMFTQLLLGRHLDNITGLILGSFLDCGPVDKIYDLVRDTFSALGVPIIAGFDFGHNSPNLTLPIGITGHIDTGLGVLKLGE